MPLDKQENLELEFFEHPITCRKVKISRIPYSEDFKVKINGKFYLLKEIKE